MRIEGRTLEAEVRFEPVPKLGGMIIPVRLNSIFFEEEKCFGDEKVCINIGFPTDRKLAIQIGDRLKIFPHPNDYLDTNCSNIEAIRIDVKNRDCAVTASYFAPSYSEERVKDMK